MPAGLAVALAAGTTVATPPAAWPVVDAGRRADLTYLEAGAMTPGTGAGSGTSTFRGTGAPLSAASH